MIQKYYRYGIAAEKTLLVDNDDTYHGLVFPAHLAVDQEASLPVFVKKADKPYFVDPMTYVFGFDTSMVATSTGDELRRSWEKMFERHQHAFPATIAQEEFLHGSRLRPSDFRAQEGWDEESLAAFANASLEIQRGLTTEDPALDRYQELAEAEGQTLSISNLTRQPEFLVAPYFFWRSRQDPWYDVAIKLAETTASLEEDENVAAVLAMDRAVLQGEDDFGELASDFGDVDGFLVWVDGFSGYTASSEELRQYRDLTDSLSSGGKFVISLYGSFLCGILSKFGMTGYSSGICYGQRKAKDTSGGGVIPSRYFDPMSYTKLTKPDFEAFLSQLGPRCDCEVCEMARDSSDSRGYFGFMETFFTPSGEADESLLKTHYMKSLHGELRQAAEMDPGGLEETLEAKQQELEEEHRIFFTQEAQHLERWTDLLEGRDVDS